MSNICPVKTRYQSANAPHATAAQPRIRARVPRYSVKNRLAYQMLRHAVTSRGLSPADALRSLESERPERI